MQRLADMASGFCGRWFRNDTRGRLAISIGPTGCGKTHVARRIAAWARLLAYDRWSQEKRGSELPRIEYAQASILSPDTCKSDSFNDRLADIATASMVIIDDIGTETDQFKTMIPAQRLCSILNRCEWTFLWLTTNKEPSSWEKQWDKRVEDRLLAGTVLEMSAPSYRSEV